MKEHKTMYLADLDCGGHVEPNPYHASLDLAEQMIAVQAFKKDAKGKLTLRASKPKGASGPAQYVWRMIVFAIPKGANHHCLPMGADFDVRDSDIPADFEPTVNEAWLAEQAKRSAETETPETFQNLNTYPFLGRDETPAADWSEYHVRRWPRERRRRYLKYLDTIADRVVATVPVRKQAGTMAWMRAIHG